MLCNQQSGLLGPFLITPFCDYFPPQISCPVTLIHNNNTYMNKCIYISLRQSPSCLRERSVSAVDKNMYIGVSSAYK